MESAAGEYDVDRPGLGDEFLSVVKQAFQRIVEAPLRYPLVDARHRAYVLRRFPFSVYYRIDDEEIVVLAIAHHKRRNGYWRRRR